jgi:UDP-glucose 4-epimerase
VRVVVTGASGNVGTSLLPTLLEEPSVEEIVGIARREPSEVPAGVRWVTADIGHDDLVDAFKGAHVVVHLAWAIQPSHDEHAMAHTNMVGSCRVFDAVARAEVPSLVYASSVGAYSEGPKTRRVDETWPAHGIGSSFYSRHKARVEAMLDRFEAAHPDVRVVRMRPGLIFKREQGSEARRFFLGPFVPGVLAHPSVMPLVPDIPTLRFQAVHTHDAAGAYRRAIVGAQRGAFNLVAEPVLDPRTIAAALGARSVRIPPVVLRAVTDLTWRLHLQPTPVGWLEMGFRAPLLSADRARDLLGWEPAHTSIDAVIELLQGIARGQGAPTPPLDPATGGPVRAGELASGVGRSDGAGDRS